MEWRSHSDFRGRGGTTVSRDYLIITHTKVGVEKKITRQGPNNEFTRRP